jgi:hypothetical protein
MIGGTANSAAGQGQALRKALMTLAAGGHSGLHLMQTGGPVFHHLHIITMMIIMGATTMTGFLEITGVAHPGIWAKESGDRTGV